MSRRLLRNRDIVRTWGAHGPDEIVLMAILPRRILPRRIVSSGVGAVLVAVVCAMVLTAPSTAATTPFKDRGPAVMTMEYSVGSLAAVVHAPRTLVGRRPLVFNVRGYDSRARKMARQGFVVVLVSDRAALSGHQELWRELMAAKGPLAQRFHGFAGHVAVSAPRSCTHLARSVPSGRCCWSRGVPGSPVSEPGRRAGVLWSCR